MNSEINHLLRCVVGIAALALFTSSSSAQIDPPGHYYHWVGHDNQLDGDFTSSAWVTDGGIAPYPGAQDAAYFDALETYTLQVSGQNTWGTLVHGGGVTFNGNYSTFLVNVGGSGTITVPAGSEFQVDDLLVGVDSGSGSVEIAGHLKMQNIHARIGAFDAGSVTVTGAMGSFTADQILTTVGDQNDGILRVEEGALARLKWSAVGQSSVIAGWSANAYGFIQVIGTGSRLETDAMSIGWDGEALLDIAGGGRATVQGPMGSSALVLGRSVNSNGDLNVQQSGSLLTIPQGGLEIARGGAADVNVATGGAINVTGNAGLTSVLLGTLSNAKGNLVASGAGSKVDIGTGALEIGREGMGRIDILNGGQITIQNDPNSPAVLVGNLNGGDGKFIISGQNSKLKSHGTFELGRLGTAQLIVQDKGSADVKKLLIASGPTHSSHAYIDGMGSSIEVEKSAEVGTAGHAFLDLLNGGTLKSQEGVIGRGGEGAVTIHGEQTKWELDEDLIIGDTTKGTLSLVDGASVHSGRIVLGAENGGDGTLYLDGVNSAFDTGELIIGQDGRGTLVLRNGATLTLERIRD